MTLAFSEWIINRRWYAGRSRELASAVPAVVTPLGEPVDVRDVEQHVLEVVAERYQVLVRWADRPLAGYPEAAVIGSVTGPDGERVAYDALY
ncbi:maltokinase, partial [Mycobacterium sp. ITM-2017-0098]